MRELILCLALFAAPLVHAFGRIVFDPSNFTRNMVSAAEAVQQTSLMLDEAARQVQQLKSLASGEILAVLAPHQAELQDLLAAVQGMRRLHGSIEQLRDNFRKRLAEAREFRMTWKEYLEAEEQRILRNHQAAIERAQEEIRIMDRVKADYEFARSMESRIAGTEGTHQAMQLMNVQMNRLLTQTAELSRALVTAVGRAESAEVSAQKHEAEQLRLSRQQAEEALRKARIEGDRRAVELLRP